MYKIDLKNGRLKSMFLYSCNVHLYQVFLAKLDLNNMKKLEYELKKLKKQKSMLLYDILLLNKKRRRRRSKYIYLKLSSLIRVLDIG